jgi:serine/threonine protein kinase
MSEQVEAALVPNRPGPTSYYPAFRKKSRPPLKCVVKEDSQTKMNEAIKEIPSPSRSRARRAKQLQADEGVAPEAPQISGRRAVTPSSVRAPAEQVVQPAKEAAFHPAGAAAEAHEVDLADLRIGECIGAGTTAEVFRASWHGTDVAVKKLRGPLPSEFQRELAVLSQFRHPHLVLFMGVSTVGNPKIVSELCEGGTLFRLLHQQKELPLSWPQRLKIALDTAKGVNFLHRQRLVHRDLKSLNLLLAAKVINRGVVPWVKVSDFGLSRFLPFAPSAAGALSHATHGIMTGGVGTALWMAPEVLNGGSYTEKVDVYSFAIVLYELLARWIPFDGSGLEPVSIAVAVTGGRRPDMRYVPTDCPSTLSRVMKACWLHCPSQRPTFDAVLDMLKQESTQS